MKPVKPYLFILSLWLFSYCHASSQPVYTTITSAPEWMKDRLSELTSLFVVSDMPKITAEAEAIIDQTVEVRSSSNLKVVKLLLSVQVFTIPGNKPAGFKVFTFTGSGKTEASAIQNAFTNLKKEKNSLKAFLDKENQTALPPDCIRAKADLKEFINTGDTKRALYYSRICSYYCPSLTNLFESTFDQIQELQCEKQLVKAKSYAANKEFGLAIREIMYIQPGTDCFKKAEAELNNIAKAHDLENDRLYKLYSEVAGNKQKYMEFFLSELLDIRF